MLVAAFAFVVCCHFDAPLIFFFIGFLLLMMDAN
jgi:hypothetical protein